MTQVTAINTAVQNLDDAIKRAQKQKAALRTHRSAINRALVPLNAAFKAGALRYEPGVSVSGNGESWWPFEFSVTGSTVELEGFKDERLVKLLGKLIDADDTKTTDFAAYLNRDFKFSTTLPDGSILRVTVNAYVKSDSPTCRKVLKESKSAVVVTEVFEMVCS